MKVFDRHKCAGSLDCLVLKLLIARFLKRLKVKLQLRIPDLMILQLGGCLDPLISPPKGL